MNRKMTLGSLFDGAGTCPFAAQICGMKPVWASEIEPFPVAVTTKRFPEMKHLGDITKISGAEIEPVDVITFGSPCQDLSVAGKRAGLDGERSGLFVEAVRIIKEMRSKTNERYPRIAVWENVPGAFSSNKGEDFRIVLEELCKVKDCNAVIPRPPKGKWSDAGEIVGDGYSLAWRVLDAQYWGVPQRRRRIFLVADFRGERAGEILFEREGLSRNFAESRKAWKGITKSLAFSTGDKSISREYGISSYASNAMKSPNPHSGVYEADTARTLDQNGGNPACNQGGMCLVQVYDARGNGNGEICPNITGDHENRITDYTAVICGMNWDGGQVAPTLTKNNAGGNQRMPDKENFNAILAVRERCGGKGCLIQENVSGAIATSNDQFLCVATQQGGAEILKNLCPTITSAAGTSGNNQPYVVGVNGDKTIPVDASYYKGQGEREGKERDFVCVVALDRAAYNQGKNAQFDIGVDDSGTAHTVVAKGPGAMCYTVDMGGGKTNVGVYENASPTLTCTHYGEPVTLYLVPCDIILRRLTPTECARLQGMPDWWCDDVPHSDSAEYKMWGNGMALPNVLYIMEGISDYLKDNTDE